MDSLDDILGLGPKKIGLPNELVKSGYSPVRLLATGGYGEAHLVFHKGRQKHYVVKQSNLRMLATRNAGRGEVAVLKKLHEQGVPHVVPFIDAIEVHPSLFCILDFAIGGDLHNAMAARLKEQRGRGGSLLSEVEVLTVVVHVGKALQGMHRLGLVHRDLNSRNIFLTGANTQKQCGKRGNNLDDCWPADFGLSGPLRTGTLQPRLAIAAGSSPELCEGHPESEADDAWALGVLLYEMISNGKLPFGGGTRDEQKDPSQLAKAICAKEGPKVPVSAAASKGDFSAGIQHLCSSMLHRNKDQRMTLDAAVRMATTLLEQCTGATTKPRGETRELSPNHNAAYNRFVEQQHRQSFPLYTNHGSSTRHADQSKLPQLEHSVLADTNNDVTPPRTFENKYLSRFPPAAVNNASPPTGMPLAQSSGLSPGAFPKLSSSVSPSPARSSMSRNSLSPLDERDPMTLAAIRNKQLHQVNDTSPTQLYGGPSPNRPSECFPAPYKHQYRPLRPLELNPIGGTSAMKGNHYPLSSSPEVAKMQYADQMVMSSLFLKEQEAFARVKNMKARQASLAE